MIRLLLCNLLKCDIISTNSVEEVENMDKRDEIIRTQLDVIGTLLNNSIRRMSDDLWGAPPAENAASPVETAGSQQPTEKAEKAEASEENVAAPEKIEALKAELDDLIGLEGIKREVNNLINMVTIHELRKQNGLNTVDMSLHMVFSGNPGTGKTMIARLMARIYKSLGVLSKGHLVEVDRSGLVAGYVGQTAAKTSEVIQKALGGVLFIDEAYTLTSGRNENDFGQEAVDTLLKAMEDNREDLVVIIAGYDSLMDTFIHSNPGLESRFNRYLHFDDYSIDEMLDILDLQLKKGQYQLTDEAKESVREYIVDANTSSIAFGNARGIRNIFERLLVAQANRLALAESLDKDALMTITAEDVAEAKRSDEKLNKALREELEAAEEQALKALDDLAAEIQNRSNQQNAD